MPDFVEKFWGELRTTCRVLDFGGGNDVMCATLRDKGFTTAVSYDPIVPEFAQTPGRQIRSRDLLRNAWSTCPIPMGGIAKIIECAAEPGLICYSTSLLPTDLHIYGLSWWYVAPRNGHVSMFSKQALAAALGPVRLQDGLLQQLYAFRIPHAAVLPRASARQSDAGGSSEPEGRLDRCLAATIAPASKPHVLQLVRIARRIDRGDAAVAMRESERIDGAVLLAHDKAGEPVDDGRDASAPPRKRNSCAEMPPKKRMTLSAP